MEELLKTIAEQAAQSVGEYVLASHKHYDFHGCSGFGYDPRPEDYQLDHEIWMGVIAPEPVEFKALPTPRLVIPVSKATFVRDYNQYRPEPHLLLHPGQLKFGPFELYGLGEELKPNATGRTRPTRREEKSNEIAFEVAVGDVAVGEWFSREAICEYNRYLLMSRELAAERWARIKARLERELQPVFTQDALEF